MPNWCSNHLIVYGNKKDLDKFLKMGIKKKEFLIGNIIPTPKELKNTISPSDSAIGKDYINKWEVDQAKEKKKLDNSVKVPKLIPCENNTQEKIKLLIEKYGSDNWYDWNSKNWGTKWDCGSDEYELSDNLFDIYFESAWAPPVEWLEKTQILFPNLLFKLSYLETGGWFAGVAYTEQSGDVFIEQGVPALQDEDGNIVESSGEDDDDNIYPINPFESKDVWFEVQIKRGEKIDKLLS
jgi:hypothetical protein